MKITKKDINKAIKAVTFEITEDKDHLAGGIVIGDDSENIENTSNTWSNYFSGQAGILPYKLHWKQVPHGIKGEPGTWILAFNGPMFQKVGSLGSLVLVASEENEGYILKEFTHGSKYFADIVSIPKSIRRSKDILPLIAREIPKWIDSHIQAKFPNLGIEITRNFNEFTFRFTSSQEGGLAMPKGQINACAQVLSDLEFSDVRIGVPQVKSRSESSVSIAAAHPLKILQF